MKKILLWMVCLIFLSACAPAPTPTAVEKPTEAQVSTITPVELVGDQTFLDKRSPNHIRFFNYNVNWDAIFPDGDSANHSYRSADRSDAFKRLIQAVQPDIVCLQEINPLRIPDQVGVIFDEVLPLEHGQKWRATIAGDNVILSKYDLAANGFEVFIPPLSDVRTPAAALVDLPDSEYDSVDLYLICAHFPSSGGQAAINARQRNADLLIRQVGDLKTVGDYIDLPQGTPFILSGDFNVYDTDPHLHLTTLVTGDIENENRFGEDIQPDWDETALTDAQPSHNAKGEEFYTWRDDSDQFNPGLLDRIIYSDSVISVGHAFVLNTMTLSPDELEAFGLLADDVVLETSIGRFDHLPMVVDFVIGD